MQDAITLPVGSTLPAGAILADGTVLQAQMVLTAPTAVLGSFGVRGQGSRSDTQDGDLLRERGEYALDFPLGVVVTPRELVHKDGRAFRVVWTPPQTAFDVAQSYGLEEVR
jgi:hypothetical protein